ncbi:helix-turn-helix transcriptional regulator, partial [Streptomyces sp. SID11385]|uniref:helix-turn-helix transcriptional regulator n=1 Tax=Streptomyces sp. SID11385 TaxID=2706031 RepID=UPI0031BB4910
MTHALPPAPDRRLLREHAGLTRAQAAARLGVSPQTLRAWERGRARPHGRRLEAYAGLLAELAGGLRTEGGAGGTGEEAARAGETARTGAPERTGEEAARPAGIPRPVETPPAEMPPAEAPAAETPAAQAPTAQAPAVEAPSVIPDIAHPEPPTAPLPLPGPPEAAFAALYGRAAPGLLRQAYLLTGRPQVALAAVLSGFRQVWERWPEVVRDPDPEGWARAMVHESALSPWRGF